MFKWLFKKKEDSSVTTSDDLKAMQHSKIQKQLRLKKRMDLPRNFAKKVIDLELQCERPDVTKDNVNSLMDLYTLAIEYYNSVSDFDN